MKPETKEIYKERWLKGPFKSKGDYSINSPGCVDNAESLINEFMASGIVTWNGDYTNHPTWAHHGLMCAAFKYSLFGDSTLKDKVLKTLNAQIAKTPVIDSNKYPGDEGFFTAEWLTRIFNAYIDLSVADQKIDNWFLSVATNYADRTNKQLAANFPNRLKRDYSVKLRSGLSEGYKNEFTHYINGKGVNLIPNIAHWYNNRRFACVAFFGVVGAKYNNQYLINSAKVYCEEFIRFSVFSDGTMGEYQRNHQDNGSRENRGYTYGSVNIEKFIDVAYALNEKGDSSLFDYSTKKGLFGTESPTNKNIELVIDNFLGMADGSIKRYYLDGRIITNVAISNGKLTEWVIDTYVAKANTYFNKWNSYLRDYNKGERIASAGPISWAWSGSGFTNIGYLFMYGETITEPTPEKDILISQHNTRDEAYQVITGKQITRKGNYEVWQRPDGTKYIIQPNIEIE